MGIGVVPRGVLGGALAFAGVVGPGAVAQEVGDTGHRLDSVTITGDPERIRNIPGSAHRLDREELERFSFGDPNRTLRRIPGLNLNEETGFGLFPNIGMRGSRVERSQRITVMEDGILMAPAPYSAPAAYYFPTIGRMDAVEVLKGSSSIKYGPYTTGGAINFRSTPIPNRAFGASAQFLLGSDGGRRHHVTAGGSGESLGWAIEGYDEGSDGFRDQNTPRRASNNMAVDDTGFDNRNIVGKLRWNTTDAPVYQQLDFKFGVADRDARETYLGLTDADFRADPFQRYEGAQRDVINTEHRQYSLRHVIAPTDDLDITTTAYYNEFARNWYKLNDIEGTGISSVLASPADNAAELAWIRGNADGSADDVLGTVRANNREYYSRGVQSELNYRLGRGAVRHDILIGARFHQDEEDRLQWEDEYAMENGSMVFQGGGVPGSQTNRETEAEALALWLQDSVRFGDWNVTGGVRYEDVEIERTDYQDGADPDRGVVTGRRSQTYSELIPGIGATYDLSPRVTLLGGVHKGFAPAGPNADARAEESLNWEAGVRYRDRLVNAELIGFYNDYDNLVGTCTASSGGGCEIGETFNGGSVEVMGLEASALVDAGRALDVDFRLPVGVTYTYTSTEFKTAFASDFGEWGTVERGDELPLIPAHQLTLSGGIGQGPWDVNLQANFVNTSRAVAGSGDIPSNEKVDARWLFDVAGSYRFTEHVRAFASVENLTDETYISARRPAGVRVGMPRTYWAGVKMDF